jgi:threonine dehydrogenase-like Zn-dependent dehydrogenase
MISPEFFCASWMFVSPKSFIVTMLYRLLFHPALSRSSFSSTALKSSRALSFTRTMSVQARTNDDLKASKLFDVSHITAVVTGGGTGIGLMITQALVSNGAKVYITGRREEALENVVKQYNTGPGKIVA